MFARFRKNRPVRIAVDPAAVAEGLRVFAADLEAGDSFALEALTDRGELPTTAEEWADYPASYVRQVRITYFGKTGPGEVPDEFYDRFDQEHGLAATA